MLTGIIALAVLALFASSSKHGTTAPAEGGMSPAVKADLVKLYQASPVSYNAVLATLGTGNPATLTQYAIQLIGTYPALGKKLGDMAAANVIPVTGASGTKWNTWGGHDAATNVSKVDILLGAMPVLSYSQVGSDKSSRKFLGAAASVDTATLARARADFGV